MDGWSDKQGGKTLTLPTTMRGRGGGNKYSDGNIVSVDGNVYSDYKNII